jgi:outer membrane protein assembly factor BamB
MVSTNDSRTGSPKAAFPARILCAILAALALLAGTTCGDGAGPGDQQDPRIRWTFAPDAQIYYGSPALSADEGTVYVGTSDPILGTQEQNALHAVAVASGALRWTYALGASQVRSTPAVGPDGSITFVAVGGAAASDVVHHLSSSGALLWSFVIGPTASPVAVGLSAPALAADGTVYVASDALYAIGPDGMLKWKALGPAAEDLRSSPVVGADGTVYFAGHNVPLTALHPDDGRVLWSLALGVNDHVFASPAIGADGTLYVATNSCVVYAVSAAGALSWTFDAATAGYECTMRSSPAVAADGTIYLGTNAGNRVSALFALRPDGTVRWIFAPSDLPPGVPFDHFDIYSSPAIGSDGTVYFGQEFGRVYALDAASGAIRWMVETRSGITWSSPALTAGGTLLISDLASRLYAIDTESRGLLGGAPWPRYRHDNASTGARSP